MKSEEEQKRIAENYTYDDYKKIVDLIVSSSATYTDDEQLKKWVIRTLAEDQLYMKQI